MRHLFVEQILTHSELFHITPKLHIQRQHVQRSCYNDQHVNI